MARSSFASPSVTDGGIGMVVWAMLESHDSTCASGTPNGRTRAHENVRAVGAHFEIITTPRSQWFPLRMHCTWKLSPDSTFAGNSNRKRAAVRAGGPPAFSGDIRSLNSAATPRARETRAERTAERSLAPERVRARFGLSAFLESRDNWSSAPDKARSRAIRSTGA
jgi:hypothetical protein